MMICIYMYLHSENATLGNAIHKEEYSSCFDTHQLSCVRRFVSHKSRLAGENLG